MATMIWCVRIERMISRLDELMIPTPEQLTGGPTAISLFSGCGGLDLGVASAGFQVLAGVEIDTHAVRTLETWTKRLPYHHQTYHADIRSLEPTEIMRDVGLVAGELDLLVGGPPCQSFSGIGFRKGLEDDRGLLLFEMARFAEVMRPRAVLIEQVKGIVNFRTSSGDRVLRMLEERFHQLGYSTTWSVVNAADYGVPQKRERIMLVALRSGERFEFPLPTHAAPALASRIARLLPHRTVADALSGLGAPERKGEPTSDPNHVDVTPERDRDRIRQVPEGGWLAAQLHLPPELRCNLSKKDTTKYRRLHREQPSLTLRCGEIHYHPIKDRYLTPREYMRLHGYPDWFFLAGPIRSRSGRVKDLDQHRQVANSVPPPLAGAVAKRVREALETAYASSAGIVGVSSIGSIAGGQFEPIGVQMPLFRD